MVALLTELEPRLFESATLLKKMAVASRALAEFKGAILTIPRGEILIHALGMQEAKDSSEIENIVTTHDEIYKAEILSATQGDPAAKEVQRYRQALMLGYRQLTHKNLITVNDLIKVQAELEGNNAGIRKLPGTQLQDSSGRTVYTPPQSHDEILGLLKDLEKFINDDTAFDADPLIKMAIIHHQFESIHPFYDGNGRTGRILNVLYLVKYDLLTIPALYLSHHIVKNKADYYRLLQEVRNDRAWEHWTHYMLEAVENTAKDAVALVERIRLSMAGAKQFIRERHRKIYSQELLNNLYMYPYTRIESVAHDVRVSSATAGRYLEQLCGDGLLEKRQMGRTNYYLNRELVRILTERF